MIKNISIENFRSIKNRVTLDLTRSKRKKSDLANYITIAKTDISSTTVIYGANASGKSNLLRAIKALEFLVINSAKYNPGDAIAPYEPFKLQEGNDKKNVFFEIEFFVETILYRYTLSFNSHEIENEKLEFYPIATRKPAILFHREKGKEIEFGKYFKGEKKTIEKITLPNQLFLSKAAENNAESILPVFHFFKDRLRVYPFLNQYYESGLERLFAKRLAEDPDSAFSRKLNALICSLDTGIQSIRARETDWNAVKFPDNIPDNIKRRIQDDYKYEIKTVHKFFDLNRKETGLIDFDIEEESKGTRSLLALGGIIIDSLEKGLVLVIDEFEKNLHPIITSYLIQLYNNKFLNPKNAQLIFATHDVTQLRDDIFNRDQVWFTQKDEFGSTELIRCSDIKGVRLNVPLDKWYMSGRLGGTAIINDTDFIIAMQEEA